MNLKRLLILAGASAIPFVSFILYKAITNEEQTNKTPTKKKQEDEIAQNVAFAKELFLQEKHEIAMKQLEEVLAKDPTNFEAAKLILAQSVDIRTKDVSKLIELGEKMLPYAPSEPAAGYMDYMLKVYREQYEEGTVKIEELSTKFPEYLASTIEQITIKILSQDMLAARELCDTIINSAKESKISNLELANIYLLKAATCDSSLEAEEKTKHLDKAISLYPKFVRALFLRASTYLTRNKIDESIEDLKKIIKVNAKYMSAYMMLGDILQNTQQLDKALQYYSKALEMKPQDLKIYESIQKVYFLQKEYTKSLQMFETELTQMPNRELEIKTQKAKYLLNYRKFEECIVACEDVIKLPSETNGYMLLSTFVTRMKILCQNILLILNKYPMMKELYASSFPVLNPSEYTDKLFQIRIPYKYFAEKPAPVIQPAAAVKSTTTITEISATETASAAPEEPKQESTEEPTTVPSETEAPQQIPEQTKETAESTPAETVPATETSATTEPAQPESSVAQATTVQEEVAEKPTEEEEQVWSAFIDTVAFLIFNLEAQQFVEYDTLTHIAQFKNVLQRYPFTKFLVSNAFVAKGQLVYFLQRGMVSPMNALKDAHERGEDVFEFLRAQVKTASASQQ